MKKFFTLLFYVIAGCLLASIAQAHSGLQESLPMLCAGGTMLTLLDLAKRNGSDAALGLLEEITTVAPELKVIPVRPRDGTSYKYTKRTGRPAGGFRGANEGSTSSKSTYEQKLGEMFFFDGIMNVDEAITKGATGDKLGDILADEGAAILEDTALKIGDQVYRGTTANAKGFAGFRATVDSTMVVDATGSGTVENVWFAYLHERNGIHFPIGNNGLIDLGEWARQQVADENDATKKLFAWVNNLSFYMGLHIPSKMNLGCIKNVTTAKPWTDALTAQMLAKFPIGRKPNAIFSTRNCNYLLQASRAGVTVAVGNKVGSGGSFPDVPKESGNVPITETDSPSTEAAW